MATVNSIDRTGGSASDVSILKLAESDFVESQNEALPEGGSRTTYKISTGDSRYPSTVVVQVKPNSKGNGGKGVRACLLALNTWARSETDGIIDVIEPINAVLSFSVPMNVPLDVADIHDLYENLISLGYETVTAKEGDDVRLSALLLFGLTKVF
jgi:hypothetical protein